MACVVRYTRHRRGRAQKMIRLIAARTFVGRRVRECAGARPCLIILFLRAHRFTHTRRRRRRCLPTAAARTLCRTPSSLRPCKNTVAVAVVRFDARASSRARYKTCGRSVARVQYPPIVDSKYSHDNDG